MVMDGGTLEEALLDPFPLACLIIESLDDYREALHEEHTTKDGDEQFLADDDDTDHSAQSGHTGHRGPHQAASAPLVALCGEEIIKKYNNKNRTERYGSCRILR